MGTAGSGVSRFVAGWACARDVEVCQWIRSVIWWG